MTDQPLDVPASDDALALTRHDGGAVVVTVRGTVDLATVPELRDAVGGAFKQAAGGTVIIDLTAVTFLGSSGLAALIEAATGAEQRSGALRVVVDSNRPVIRPLKVTGLASVLALYDTVEDALINAQDQGTNSSE